MKKMFHYILIFSFVGMIAAQNNYSLEDLNLTSSTFGFIPSDLEGSSETLRNSRADKNRPTNIRKKTSIDIYARVIGLISFLPLTP